MSSPQYLDYLGSVWSGLPEEDKARLGELWQGFEQVIASIYQKYVEGNLNIAQQDLQAFSTERWLPYEFTADNFVDRPAVFTSTQDISLGVNLTSRYLLKLGVDGGTPIEMDVRGLVPGSTQLAEITTIINAAFHFNFSRGVIQNSLLQLVSPTSGLLSRIDVYPPSDPAADASEFVLGLQDSDLPKMFPEFSHIYKAPYPSLVSVPVFQDHVRDESVTVLLQEGPDYHVLPGSLLAFKSSPPALLWARKSLFDQENPWNNFGFLMDIYQPNSVRYVDALQGLWFAFWTGPKPDNVKKSLYLLFGLPTAQEAGVVTSLTLSQIQTTSAAGLVRTFAIPTGLVATVTLGQAVEKFDPLVSGISVFDKINRPGFIADEIGRSGIQRFLTDEATRGPGDTDETKALTMLEEYTFLPQIDVNAFINPDINLGNVKTFLDAIKPLNKTYLFQIIAGNFTEELLFGDSSGADPSIDLTENVDSNETTFLLQADLDAYETVDNSGLNLDPHGVLFEETVAIEVYSFGILIDSFLA